MSQRLQHEIAAILGGQCMGLSKGERVFEVIIRIAIVGAAVLGADVLALIMFVCRASAPPSSSPWGM